MTYFGFEGISAGDCYFLIAFDTLKNLLVFGFSCLYDTDLTFKLDLLSTRVMYLLLL